MKNENVADCPNEISINLLPSLYESCLMRKKTYISNEAAHGPARLSSPVLNNITNRTVGVTEDKITPIGIFSLSMAMLNPNISGLLCYSKFILRIIVRTRITPIGRVSNLRKRSVIKNSLLNIPGNSDVLIPIRDSNPIEIKPIIGSPKIKETTVRLFSHQG